MNQHEHPGAQVLQSTEVESPVGDLTLVAADDALVAVLWPDDDPTRVRLAFRAVGTDANHVLSSAAQQLGEYFAGSRTVFELVLAPVGTEFQSTVWAALRTIPYGQTWTYGELAKSIGRPAAARAVGAANAKNPISIIVPCHRVVGSGGHLTGFAGGLVTKRRLLDLEQDVVESHSTHSWRRAGQFKE